MAELLCGAARIKDVGEGGHRELDPGFASMVPDVEVVPVSDHIGCAKEPLSFFDMASSKACAVASHLPGDLIRRA